MDCTFIHAFIPKRCSHEQQGNSNLPVINYYVQQILQIIKLRWKNHEIPAISVSEMVLRCRFTAHSDK